MPDRSPQERLTVMISSTARDLPAHREKVMHACLRAGVFPRMMEHLPASDDDAIAASLRMVDEADIYLGLVARRYGYVPQEHSRSITEMEYDRAVERGIPRLVFLMHDEHPLTIKDVETGEVAQKVEAFRARLATERVASFFKSPDELLGQALHAIEEERRRLEAERAGEQAPPPSLHYVAAIPAPPEPYIAHPYTLLQTRGLVGRRAELEGLTDWIVRPEKLNHARFLAVVAIGGLGKSALTWHWFHQIAPQEMRPLAGRIWWSFYESDATYENFVTRTLAYVSRRSLDVVSKLLFPERETELLAWLNWGPFLVVLDGLERILVAYARADASRLLDDDLDEATANRVAGGYGLPASAGQSFIGAHPLRKTADPRAGRFLQKLVQVRASRVLASTRLYPAELQTATGAPRPGCAAVFLPGLSDQDALELWRAQGALGSREEMLPYFERFEKHPLLLQALAGEVARFRETPGDFDAWRKANPAFDPFALPLVQVKSHVLEVAIRGLTPAERRTLHVLAGFRMPTDLETLRALLVRAPEEEADPASKPFASLAELDAALTGLEDRGLLGWDRRANRYDLHPIVRGVVWSGLGEHDRAGVRGALRDHFSAISAVGWQDVESLDDLAPAIELYHTLIDLGRLDEAFTIYRDQLVHALLYRLRASHQQAVLLERLFPEGLLGLPKLSDETSQRWTLHATALAYGFSGRPQASLPFFQSSIELAERHTDDQNLAISLHSFSDNLRLIGKLQNSEVRARRALGRSAGDKFNIGVSLQIVGSTVGTCGREEEASRALHYSLAIFKNGYKQAEGVVRAAFAQLALQAQSPTEARPLADKAWQLAAAERHEYDFIRAARLQGTGALRLSDFSAADERLHHALTRARGCQLVEEELPTLVALAELEIRRGEPARARELLDEIWEPAELGPYPLFHADALNFLTRIERDVGNRDAAVAAAIRAYELSWCDGPPFAYHWGLEAARKHLRELGAPEPDLPPFDPSKYEPMPEVEIDPPDDPIEDKEDEEG